MKKINFLILCALLFAIPFSLSIRAQELTGGFYTELTLEPSLTTSLHSLVYLDASFKGVTFRSETVFDLISLDTQSFQLSFTIGILAIREEVVFKGPGFSFSRNDLLASVTLAGLDLGINFLLENSTGINPGLVIKLGGKTGLGIGLYSYTGFGTTEIAEDLEDRGKTDLCNTETWSFACRRPLIQLDADPDREVKSPFVFTEEVVRLSFDVDSFTFLSDTKFTGAGFDQEVFSAGYAFDDPDILFTSTSVFDNTVSFAEQVFRLEAGIAEQVNFYSVTYISGPPLSFSNQEFKFKLEIEGFRLLLTTLFDTGGFSKLSLCLGFEV